MVQAELPYGTWFDTVTCFTPGTCRSSATSRRVCAWASARRIIDVVSMRSSSASAMPLGAPMRSTRCAMRCTALHTIAPVSAISTTMSAAAVLWRRSVDRIERISMAAP